MSSMPQSPDRLCINSDAELRDYITISFVVRTKLSIELKMKWLFAVFLVAVPQVI